MNLDPQCSFLSLFNFYLGKQVESSMLPNVLQQQHMLYFPIPVFEDVGISHVAQLHLT